MDSPESDSLCDRFVTGNLDIDNWILIIEYFAKFKTELWMLHDVFEMAPELPDYLGEHTNEMVAFRCLASLFDSDVVSDTNSKVEFDSSESCEYVLQCILDEIPLSELKPGAPGLSKWNLLPFIKSKLLCLPKCALELMIEPSSQEKDTQVLSPCNDEETLRSGGIETERLTPSPSMAEPDLMGRTEGGQSFSRNLGDGTEEISRSSEKDTQLSTSNDEEILRSDGIGTERVTSPMAEPDLMGRIEGGQSFCHDLGDGTEEISRSSEKDTQSSTSNDEEILRSDGIETERVTSPMAEPDLMGRIEGGKSFCRDLVDGTEEISRSYEKDTHISPCDDEETVKSDGIETERLTPPMAEPDLMEKTEGRQSFCHDFGDGNEEINRSHELLERQNGGLENTSPAEKIYRCIHCKQSGKLLFCSGDSCEVMVHQKCLDSPPAYDDDGNFYCSRCSLTCTSAEYLQSQDEVAKAKMKLVSFLRLMSEVIKKKSTERS